MKAIKFKGHNTLMGDNQPEYESIPAYREDDKVGSLVICFELNEEEKKQVAETGCIYLKQLTYGVAMAPIHPSLLRKDTIPKKPHKIPTTLDQKEDQLDVIENSNRSKMRSIVKKIGRNEPCPCGSGKKFKKCHLPGIKK